MPRLMETGDYFSMTIDFYLKITALLAKQSCAYVFAVFPAVWSVEILTSAYDSSTSVYFYSTSLLESLISLFKEFWVERRIFFSLLRLHQKSTNIPVHGNTLASKSLSFWNHIFLLRAEIQILCLLKGYISRSPRVLMLQTLSVG